MKCFYHSADLDGHCSGAIVKLAYPECEMYPINYEDKFPWDDIIQGETVFMVDFSLQPFHHMIMLNKRANLIWIDHHKSAIEDSVVEGEEQTRAEITGARDTNYAGCELTWKYLYPNSNIPSVVYLLGRYDVWDFIDDEVYPFQMGMRQYNTNPKDEQAMVLWKELIGFHYDPVISDIINQGQIIIDYQTQQNAKLSKSCAFELIFQGLNFIAANVMGTNSKFFNVVWDDSRHDAMLLFGWKKGQWKISMFTTPEKIEDPGIDVGKIAKSMGGGGHAGAAGFQCSELPFDIK